MPSGAGSSGEMGDLGEMWDEGRREQRLRVRPALGFGGRGRESDHGARQLSGGSKGAQAEGQVELEFGPSPLRWGSWQGIWRLELAQHKEQRTGELSSRPSSAFSHLAQGHAGNPSVWIPAISFFK